MMNRASRHGIDVAAGLAALAISLVVAARTYNAAGRVPVAAVACEGSYDFWFDADPDLVEPKLSSRWDVNSAPSNRHPLLNLVSFPAVKIVRGLLGLDRRNGLRMFLALIAALWVGMLYVILRLNGSRPLDSFLFCLLGAASSAAMFWMPIPESWTLGSLTILGALLLVAWAKTHRVTEGWAVLVSALTLGVSITNWVAGLLSAWACFPWRRALQVTVNAFCLAILLWRAEIAFYGRGDFFLFQGDAGHYIGRPEQVGPAGQLRTMLGHTLIMPALEERPRPRRAGHQLTVETARLGSSGPLGAVGTTIWLLLLMGGFLAAIRLSERDTMVPVLLGFGAWQMLLHHFFGGEETFLYSMHWLPVWILTASYFVRGRWSSIGRALALAVILIAAVNNSQQLDRGFETLRGYAEVLEATPQCAAQIHKKFPTGSIKGH